MSDDADVHVTRTPSSVIVQLGRSEIATFARLLEGPHRGARAADLARVLRQALSEAMVEGSTGEAHTTTPEPWPDPWTNRLR
jgi:hypothetical protein